ncbi:MAG: PEGA domain-containing protein [Myxococcota bacterium]
MNAAIVVHDGGGERSFGTDDLPLVVGGGPEAQIAAPEFGGSDILALLSIADDAPFVQPGPTGVPVTCNGRRIDTSCWLNDGDVIRVGTVSIHCEFAPRSIDFRVHRASAETDDAASGVPDPPEPAEIEPIDIAPAERGHEGRFARFRTPRAIFAAVLTPFVVFGWYLFTARSVHLDIRPDPDRVSVSGALLHFALADRHLLRAGPYTIRAEKAGYRALDSQIEVGDEAIQSFSFTMDRLPGRLSVSTPRVVGAEVRVDGERVGVTPLADVEVDEGRHALRVTSTRYLPHASEIFAEGGGAETRVEIELLPGWAEVSVGSVPTGARLWVDGEEIGSTPLTAELLAGSRKLEIRLEGYKSSTRVLPVEAGEPQALEPVVLEPADGRLSLRSAPPRADVVVDGRFLGQTPIEIPLTPDRPHVIQLSRPGYESASRTLTVRSREVQPLRIRLAERRGEVQIVTVTPGSQLFVDGVARGEANQQISLRAVPHVLEVRKEGYETHRVKLTPRPGLPQRLRVRLLTRAEAELADIPRRSTTSQGQAMSLIGPASFTMGAPRREPGRRANEVERRVDLERPFYIATKETTNLAFREFAAEHRSGLFDRFSLEGDEYPVVQVTWEEAARYCNWLSRRESLPPAYSLRDGRLMATQPLTTGYRLPTEAEWARVARYAAGEEPLKYPWGPAFPPEQASGNFADASAARTVVALLPSYTDGHPVTAPVGDFSANELGIHDLGGNVAEWTHDHYEIPVGSIAQLGSERSGSSPTRADPSGPPDGKYHVIRGSSWRDSSITELRLSYRDYGRGRREDLGFRIARYAK